MFTQFHGCGFGKPLKPLMASSAGHCWSEGLGGRGGFIHRLGAAVNDVLVPQLGVQEELITTLKVLEPRQRGQILPFSDPQQHSRYFSKHSNTDVFPLMNNVSINIFCFRWKKTLFFFALMLLWSPPGINAGTTSSLTDPHRHL